MTDNEIIKALECCTKQGCSDNETKECPLKPYEDCSTRLAINALDLINRQKAEIARLQKTQDDIDNFARDLCEERVLKGKAIADFEDLQEYIRKEKSEAIREFAKELMCNLDGDIGAYTNAGHILNVYEWLYSYLRSKGTIKEEDENG